ncbi:hypothetical protein PTO0287 [Picrophilus oshimae DSM 9789]|uniref:FHA domain-containing protein n=2 Tax=Picrophilus oshimae TaxID=46632 RepID=Q6L2D0_PICTO|nr:hypothetical protein PTO0287 [Picrophilus oshimae DSM 9789]
MDSLFLGSRINVKIIYNVRHYGKILIYNNVILFMTWKCNICGTENEDEDEFCVVCGSTKVVEENNNDQILDQPVDEKTEADAPEEMPMDEDMLNEAGAPEPEKLEGNDNAEPQAPENANRENEPEIEKEPDEPEMEHVEVKMTGDQVTGKPSFIIVNSPDARFVKSKIPLEFDVFPEITIGRSPENVIVVPDADVSKKHAVIRMNNNVIEIEDLNSTNGTFLYDGKFVKLTGKTPLKNNALIRFGYSTMFKLVFD